MTDKLPPFLREMLDNPPIAGQGVHAWMYKVSRQLHAHMPATEIVALLEDRLANCGRHVPRSEIHDAVKNSISCAWQPSGVYRPSQARQRWPAVDQQQRDAIIRSQGGLADLWGASPLRIEDNSSHTEEVIDRLFTNNPLLCCGRSERHFDTKHREEWRGELAGLQYIVPSAMSDRTGLTKDGRESAHCQNNTGPRRFLVCDFDTGSTDEHAAILLHLADFAPMVCALHSGGKSLHGWFLVAGEPEEKVRKLFRYAVSLGADSTLWDKSHLVRIPDGTRDNGNRQTVFYLNLRPLEINR